MANLGRMARRDREGVFYVIARSDSDEAIHLSLRGKLDCFAYARNDGLNSSSSLRARMALTPGTRAHPAANRIFPATKVES